MKTNKILTIILIFTFLGFAYAYNSSSLDIKKEIIETSYCKDGEKSCSKKSTKKENCCKSKEKSCSKESTKKEKSCSKESTKKENCSKGKSCCKTTGKAVVDCDKKKQGCCKNSK